MYILYGGGFSRSLLVEKLPQGRFRDLLSADTNKPQKIFQIFLQTGVYKRIEEALRQNAKLCSRCCLRYNRAPRTSRLIQVDCGAIFKIAMSLHSKPSKPSKLSLLLNH